MAAIDEGRAPRGACDDRIDKTRQIAAPAQFGRYFSAGSRSSSARKARRRLRGTGRGHCFFHTARWIDAYDSPELAEQIGIGRGGAPIAAPPFRAYLLVSETPGVDLVLLARKRRILGVIAHEARRKILADHDAAALLQTQRRSQPMRSRMTEMNCGAMRARIIYWRRVDVGRAEGEDKSGGAGQKDIAHDGLHWLRRLHAVCQ